MRYQSGLLQLCNQFDHIHLALLSPDLLCCFDYLADVFGRDVTLDARGCYADTFNVLVGLDPALVGSSLARATSGMNLSALAST